MTIYYLCPDFPHPSGGVRRIYSHVEILCRAGFDARVLHMQSGFRPRWFETDVSPLAFEDGVRFDPDDRFVVPESMADILPRLSGCRRVLFLLNPYYVFESQDPDGVLAASQDVELMTNSRTIARFMGWLAAREDVAVVETGIDPALFHPRDKASPSGRGRTVRVAFTRRKDSASDSVLFLARRYLARSGVELEVLDMEDLPLEEYAATLRRADIWLTTALVHGFPRSTLEAMACGCLCLGFPGVCAGDVIEPGRNFLAVSDGDFFSLTRELVRAVGAMQCGGLGVRKVIDGGLETASRHTPEDEELSVLEVWRRWVGEP